MFCIQHHSGGSRHSSTSRIVLFLTYACFQQFTSASGQENLPATPNLTHDYSLQIRILTSTGINGQVLAQRWSRAFENLERNVSIEVDNGRDTPGIHVDQNRKQESLRVVGVMDRQGNVRFGNRLFQITDEKELKDFFADLTKHGPGGPVREQPTWGLNDDQYQQLLRHLAAPCRKTVDTATAVDLVKAINLPDEFLVTWSESARHPALTVQKETRMDFERMSTGSALAVGLAQFGLGFRPLAGPDGGILIEIDTGDESSNLWPIGWPNTGALSEAAPKAFEAIPVDLEDAEVDALIATIADKVNVPCFYASHSLNARGIDVTSLTYSRKPEKLAPLRLLQLIGSKHKMALELRTDEAGDIFLWCTTKQEHETWINRFKRAREK